MAKAFSWSYSKWKNFVACPKRHKEVDLDKHFVDSSEALTWGNEVHHGMAAACLDKAGISETGSGRDRLMAAPLPATMSDYQHWINHYADPALPGQLLVEQKYALTKDFRPTSWFGNDAWYRGVCDLARIDGSVARAADWKTGKILQDSRQLMLMAQCLFSYIPRLKRILTEFVWLKDDCKTPEVFSRDAIHREWPPVLAVVKEMEEAERTQNYPPKPNHLCYAHCPVSSCSFHRKRV